MKIKSVTCEQFAGLQGSGLQFDNGLNLVVGENESGKSTMADLIYQLLFKDVKLDSRTEKDTDFIEKYFPKKVDGPKGDVIDGILVFETANGTYRLRKEWENKTGVCRLTLPDGTSIKNNEEINTILAEELKHRAGVYSEIVFPSQKREQMAIESIMKTLGKKDASLSETRANLTSTLTQAALETGGVSLEKIEKKLTETMVGLGRRWDFAADAPEGGAKRASYQTAWANIAGTIAAAYYEADEVRSRQMETEKAERVVETEKTAMGEIQKQKKEIETERNEFQKFRSILGQKRLLLEKISDADVKISEQMETFQKWPHLIKEMDEAKKLRTKKEQASVHELYLKARDTRETYLSEKEKLEKMTQVDQKDIETLRKRLLQTEREKAKLFGMNITAKMKPLGEASVKVCLSASGEEMTETDGQYDITEAVDITVPGVFSMSLTPKGIDLESVKAAIKEAEEIIKALYEKYHVSSLDELQNLSDTYQSSWKRTEDFERELQKIIGEKSWEDLEAENKNVPESIESVKEIDLQIRALCGLESVDRFIGKKEAILSEYEKKYGSMEELQKMMEFAKNEKNDSQKQLESLGKVPEKFAAIQNPETHDSLLQGRIADCEREMNQHNELLRTAERNLGEKSAEEYSEELQQKEAELEARKTEYQHWKNIYDVFLRLKEKTAANPTEDIEEKFREYLALISDGGLTLHSIDEKLSVKLASGNRELTYDILSDGTKDTIALAFRLAMLEHLYPDGDGLAVFDDPFTDMDPKRVEQSCKLVQKFAKNNQVIFITCDEKYRDFLEGNVLQVVK